MARALALLIELYRIFAYLARDTRDLQRMYSKHVYWD
jgi:hypothetical protein